jgi:hypothetical protein
MSRTNSLLEIPSSSAIRSSSSASFSGTEMLITFVFRPSVLFR